jgi:hypothetical protein
VSLRNSSVFRPIFVKASAEKKRERWRFAAPAAFDYSLEVGLTGNAHRPAEHQEADGYDPTPSDADGDARPRDTHRGRLSGQE